MAVVAMTNEYVALNGTNISDHIKSATLAVDVNQLDATAMGDAWTDVVGGLKSGTLNLEILDDFAAGSIDATLWPLLGTVVTFEVRPDAGSVSTSNPKYTGSVLISGHSAGAAVGELSMKSQTYPTSGVVTRATS